MQNGQEILVLDAEKVRELLEHDEVLRLVRRAFELHSSRGGRVFPLVREPVGDGAVFGIKSGEIAVDKVLGLKAAGFWPANRSNGKQAHQAIILLIDSETGRAKGILDGNHVTTMRTGAAGAIGILTLARADSASLCLFGSGVQATIQLDYALRVCPSLYEVHYVTVDGARDPAFENRFRSRCVISHEEDADRAVSGADIVITATPSRRPLFSVDAVMPGTHINAVGADAKGKRELPDGLLEMAQIIADDEIQARIVGESQWTPDCELAEMGDVLLGKKVFQRDPLDITIFDMTGLALQDLVVSEFLYEQALAEGLGRRLPWP